MLVAEDNEVNSMVLEEMLGEEGALAALQPGTVRSRLSQPFVGDDGLLPEEAARRLLGVIDRLPADGRAHFVDHLGKHIPW